MTQRSAGQKGVSASPCGTLRRTLDTGPGRSGQDGEQQPCRAGGGRGRVPGLTMGAGTAAPARLSSFHDLWWSSLWDSHTMFQVCSVRPGVYLAAAATVLPGSAPPSPSSNPHPVPGRWVGAQAWEAGALGGGWVWELTGWGRAGHRVGEDPGPRRAGALNGGTRCGVWGGGPRPQESGAPGGGGGLGAHQQLSCHCAGVTSVEKPVTP